MKLISVYLTEQMVNAIDELVNQDIFTSRGECVRLAVRDLIRHEREKTIHPTTDEGIPVYG